MYDVKFQRNFIIKNIIIFVVAIFSIIFFSQSILFYLFGYFHVPIHRGILSLYGMSALLIIFTCLILLIYIFIKSNMTVQLKKAIFSHPKE